MPNLKQLFILSLLVIVLAVTFQGYRYYFSKVSLPPMNDPLYENPGYCSRDMNTSVCMGSYDIHFVKVLRKQKIPEKQRAEQVTKWLSQRNKIYNTVEVNYINNSYKLMAKLNLFETNEMILQNMISAEYFTENMDLSTLQNDISLVEKLQLSPVNSGTLSLIYHMYHYKESKLQPWMLTFPEKLPSLVKDITIYEVELLGNDITSQQVMHFIRTMQNEFIELQKEISSKWNETNRKQFFKEHSYKLDDYFYARMVLYQCGLPYPSKQIFLLSPSTLYTQATLRPKQLNDFSYLHTDLEENKTIIVHTIKIDREVKKGDAVEVEWEETGEAGLVLRGNGNWEAYCVRIQVANWEALNENQRLLILYPNKQQKTCLKYTELHQKLLIFINDVQSYDEEEAKKCVFQLDQIKKKYIDKNLQFEDIEQQEMLQIIEKTCAKPVEKVGKGFEFVLGQMEENQGIYQQKIVRAGEYLALRQTKKKSDENARLILQLFKDKLQLITKLKEYIETELKKLTK